MIQSFEELERLLHQGSRRRLVLLRNEEHVNDSPHYRPTRTPGS
jgi:hypothetical protein